VRDGLRRFDISGDVDGVERYRSSVVPVVIAVVIAVARTGARGRGRPSWSSGNPPGVWFQFVSLHFISLRITRLAGRAAFIDMARLAQDARTVISAVMFGAIAMISFT